MLLDSWAWMELLREGPKAERVEQVLDQVPTVYTCPAVVAELYSLQARRGSEAAARRDLARIIDQSALVVHDEAQAFEAGRVHAEMRRRVRDFPLTDAFVLAAARSRDLQVLSGDPHFKGLPDVVFIG